MSEYPVSFTQPLFSDYPRKLPDAVSYMGLNGTVDKIADPDLYLYTNSSPSTTLTDRIWVQKTPPSTSPTPLPTPAPASYSSKLIAITRFGAAQNKPVAFTMNGDSDPSFSVSSWYYASAIPTVVISGPDGSVYIAGVNLAGSIDGCKIYKLNSNGTIDNTFSSSVFTHTQNFDANSQGYISGIAFDSTNKLYVYGVFNFYGSNAAKSIVRLNTNGSYDSAFNSQTGVEWSASGNPSLDGYISYVNVFPNGHVYLGGQISKYKGVNNPNSNYSTFLFGLVVDNNANFVCWSDESMTTPIVVSSTAGYAFYTLNGYRYIYDPSTPRLYPDKYYGYIYSIGGTSLGTYVINMPDNGLLAYGNIAVTSSQQFYRGYTYPEGTFNQHVISGGDKRWPLKLIAPNSISGSKQIYYNLTPPVFDSTFSAFSPTVDTSIDYSLGRFLLSGALDKKLAVKSPSDPSISSIDLISNIILGPDLKLYYNDYYESTSPSLKTASYYSSVSTNSTPRPVSQMTFLGTPGIQTPQYVDAYIGSSFSLAVTTTPGATSYSASNLPGGLTINGSTGVISGTPLLIGVYNVTLSATNSYGTGTKGLIINVTGGLPTNISYTKALRSLRGSGTWREFSPIFRGDIVLVPSGTQILFPWGESDKLYDMSPWGEPAFTVPTLPSPPSGFKYKYYIGARISTPSTQFIGS
jgi:hypothetical protein